jgi:SAM-dependent methyltransferase
LPQERGQLKNEDIAKNYNGRAEQYAAMIDGLFDGIWNNILPRITIPQNAKVLDLGCGTGNNLSRLMHLGKALDLTGVDICPDMIVEAEKRIKPEAGKKGERLSLHCEDCLSFLKKAAPDNYDLVVASFLLGYIDPQRLFPAVSQTMKKGAKLVIVVTSGDELDQIKKDMGWFVIKLIRYFNPLDLLFTKMNPAPPIGKTIQALNNSGFIKIILSKEIMETAFADPRKLVRWMDESGFVTGFFDIYRKLPADKKERLYEEAQRYLVAHNIKFMGEPFIPDKPFKFRLPLHVIIAEK